MNKTELIAAVAEKTGLSKKDTEAVISATLGTITAALHEEEKVQLMGFGSFEVKAKLGYEVSGTINVLVTEKK